MGRRGRAAGRWWARRLARVGLVIAVVVMVRALHVDGAAAPDADPSPAALEEILARTVAAPQARYAAEVRVEVAPRQVLVLRHEGAYDRASRQAWHETSWRRPDRPVGPAQVIHRIHVVDNTVFLQPRLAAPTLGLPSTAWLTTSSLEPHTPDPVDDLAHSLAGLAEHRTTGPQPDVQVDHQGRLRHMKLIRGPTTIRLDVLAYGEPVAVERPDPAEARPNAVTVLRNALAALADEGRR